MAKHYIFFTKNTLPQPRADLVQVTNSANAAANLGYSSVLAHISKDVNATDPRNWLLPFQPKRPEKSLAEFYNMQDKLKVAALPVPWPMGRVKKKWADVSTLVCKYHLPIHMRPVTQIVQTRDWNFAKAAVQCGIPAIYEHNHHDDKRFEPEIVNNPLLVLAVTVVDTVQESMIRNGMPAEKVLRLHSGFNQVFSVRQTEQAETWRQTLLSPDYQYLAVYSGGLYKFKGVDLLLDVAKALPHVYFVFAGGNEAKVEYYRTLAQEKGVQNAKFLGHLPHEQLPSLLQSADVLLHPHLSGEEASFTSPLKFFEYMATGTPIVATGIPSLLEFKPPGVVAGWCEPDDPVQFTQCLQQVLETHPRKSEGYTNSINFAQQFSWESRISKILSHVDESMRPVPIS
ncbi:MAG TPA: glycosyltransferase [Crinalium sp.]|jgi:glycosyltransferase involved in cell wall biosynthesis